MDFETNVLLLKNLQEIKEVSENPIVKGFSNMAKAVPLLNFGVETVEAKFKKDFENKLKIVLEEIITSRETITPEMLEDIEVISGFLQMMEAVKKTQVNKKIIIFARLFKNSFLIGDCTNHDEYEEYLNVLSELSYREIDILLTYYRHMIKIKELTNVFESTTYQDFKEEIFSRYPITEDELTDVLSRLQNKSLCVFMMGHSYTDRENISTFSTAYFKKLALRISGESVMNA